MKLYTKTGDNGKTSVIGGRRVDKDDARVEAYGTVDELNCAIGWAIVCVPDSHGHLKNMLRHIQHDLFDLGVDLATLAPKAHKITAEKVAFLESIIDELSEQTPEIGYFILPGGTAPAAALHVSRAVCRRAERAVVRLSKKQAVHQDAKAYVNRLSDLLFAAARYANHAEQVEDIRYESR